MKCTHVQLPNGINAIVCGRVRRQRCACGKTATRACDWKVPGGKTCDAPLCKGCTHSPAPDKDLCSPHKKMWQWHPSNPEAST